MGKFCDQVSELKDFQAKTREESVQLVASRLLVPCYVQHRVCVFERERETGKEREHMTCALINLHACLRASCMTEFGLFYIHALSLSLSHTHTHYNYFSPRHTHTHTHSLTNTHNL